MKKRSQSIEYQGCQIHYSIEGEGPVLVFLHGWPTNSSLWNHQVEALQTNFKVITIDWPGFGQSDKPLNHHYTFTSNKEVLNQVLAKVLRPEESVSLIAHDIGGPSAILWASENPVRVQRLILLNTIVFPFSTTLDRLSHIFFAIPGINHIIMSQFGLTCLMKILTRSRGRILNGRIAEVLGAHKNFTRAIKLKTILEPLKEGKKKEFHDLSKRFKKLEVDKYLIIAKSDPLCYAHIKQLKEENPEVPAYTIENCGHYIPIDRPKALNEILSKILEK